MSGGFLSCLHGSEGFERQGVTEIFISTMPFSISAGENAHLCKSNGMRQWLHANIAAPPAVL